MGNLSHSEAQRLWLEITNYAQAILSVEQARVKAARTGSTEDDAKHMQAQNYSVQRRDVLRGTIGKHIEETN